MVLFLCAEGSRGQTGEVAGASVFNLSLEELMNTPVTVASRKPETVFSSPGTVYVITGDEIRRHGWRELSEVLNATVPNLFSAYDGHKHLFGARGFDLDGARVLLMVDGRVMTGISFSKASILGDSFGVANIERVEVLMGPNSTLYGADALEAVVNVVTRSGGTGAANVTEAHTIRGSGDVQQNSFVARRVTPDAEIGFHYTEYVADQDWPEWARFYRSNSFIVSQPPRASGPWQQHKEDRTMNLYARYKGLYAGYNYWRVDASPDVFEAPWFYTSNPYGMRDVLEFMVPYVGYTHEFDANLRVNAEMEYRYFEHDKLIAVNSAGVASGKIDHEREITPVYKCRMDWTPGVASGPAHKFTLGGEYRNSVWDRTDRVEGADGGGVAFNPSNRLEGSARCVYAQDVVALVPEKVTLTVGLSYNDFSSVTNAAWTPRASLVWLTGPESAWKLTYGEGVREDGTGADMDKPERLRMVEANYSRGCRSGGLHLLSVFSTYWMAYDNMMRSAWVRQPSSTSGGWVGESIPSLRVFGAEEMLRATWKRSDAYISACLNDREEEPTRVGEMTAFVPAYMLKAGLSVRLLDHLCASVDAVHLGRTRSYVESSPYDGTAYQRSDLPSWTKVDVNLRLDSLRLGGMDGAFNLRMGNIFNEEGLVHYPMEQAVGLMIEPRTIRADLSLAF